MKKSEKNISIIVTLIAIFCVLVSIFAYAAYAENQSYTYSTKQGDSSSTPAYSRTWTQVSDDTWTMDVNSDGKTDVTLTSSINADGEQVWTYTFNVEDNEQAYNVYEEMTNNGSLPLKTGYTASGSDGKNAIPQESGVVDDKTHTYTITNHKDHTTVTPQKTGSLKLTKNVTGSMKNESQKFAFTITLTGNTTTLQNEIKGMKVFGDVPFSDGVAKVSLGNGESKEMTDIPVGITYKIEETVPDGYDEPSKTNDTGTIKEDTDPDTFTADETSTWTNNSTYAPPAPRETVSWTLAKKVEGLSAPEDASYSFHVLLENLDAGKSYTVTAAGKDETVTADDGGSVDMDISLKKDETAVFKDLPAGSTYQVTEDGGDYKASYEITDAAGKNMAVQTSSSNGTENQTLSTAKETADEGEDVTVTFTNTYASVQTLSIRKLISKEINGEKVTTDKSSDGYKNLSDDEKTVMNTEAGKQFEVTVDFASLPSDASITSDVGKITADEYGEASKTFKVTTDGTPVVFHDVPVGTVYRVTETGNDYKPSYQITTADSKGKTITGTILKADGEGKVEEALSTGTGEGSFLDASTDETVEENQSDTVTLTNEEAGINFGLHKVDAKDTDKSVEGAQYSLYKWDNGEKKEMPASEGNPNGTTDKDGFAGWKNLETGTYILTEEKAPDGYSVNEDIIFVIREDGTVKYATSTDTDEDAKKVAAYSDSDIDKMETWEPEADKKTADDGSKYTVFQIAENAAVSLPKTGGYGIYAIMIFAACITAFGIIYGRKGRKNKVKTDSTCG